jgi:mono/diheme cytochrome c family protein
MKRHTARIAAFVAASAAMLGLALQPASGDEPKLYPLAAKGKVIFDETAGDVGCAACHGEDARGDGAAPDIRKAGEAQIRDGLEHTGDMRGFGLTPVDIRAVAAYLTYLRKKQGI